MHSSTSCAIAYCGTQNPSAQSKLQAELDGALGHDDHPIASWAIVKGLPYPDAPSTKASGYLAPFPWVSPLSLPRMDYTFWAKFSQRVQF